MALSCSNVQVLFSLEKISLNWESISYYETWQSGEIWLRDRTEYKTKQQIFISEDGLDDSNV